MEPFVVVKNRSEKYVKLLKYLLEREGNSVKNDPNSDVDCDIDHHNDIALFLMHSPYVLSIPELVKSLKEGIEVMEYLISKRNEDREAVIALKNQFNDTLKGIAISALKFQEEFGKEVREREIK